LHAARSTSATGVNILCEIPFHNFLTNAVSEYLSSAAVFSHRTQKENRLLPDHNNPARIAAEAAEEKASLNKLHINIPPTE
jgi:hypothetical protein